MRRERQTLFATLARGAILAVVGVVLAVPALALPVAALAMETTAPHVPMDENTDTCAMCHRSHSAASDVKWQGKNTTATGYALIVGVSTGQGDTGMCYSCHGIEILGAESDVLTAFLADSHHRVMPETSAFGPEKQCSTCHDSHGVVRAPGGGVYPALLRVRDASAAEFYTGEELCAACHADRPLDTWDGLAVWRSTRHASLIATPASGTMIRCSACHSAHGSPTAPSILGSLTPPAAPATYSVAANDRRLCFGCHAGAQDTWAGSSRYATSSHAVSTATVTIPGEWASRLALRTSSEPSRTVGECQVCHAPMGRALTTSTAIPRLLNASGRALCDSCHRFGGVAAADIASLAIPASIASQLELFAAWDPTVSPSAYGRMAVYTQEPTPTAPRSLQGPREYALGQRFADAAAGDIDGDGLAEVVTVDPAASSVRVFSVSSLDGVSDAAFAVATSSVLAAIGDFVVDGSGLPEVALVHREGTAPFASQLRLYRWDGGGFTLVDGPVSVGNDASSMASGDTTGGAAAEAAVTSAGDDRLRVLTWSGGSFVETVTLVTKSRPRGVSIGDASAGGTKDEIVVVNAGEAVDNVSVFDENGYVTHYNAAGVVGAVAQDSAIANVLPTVTPFGTSGAEVLVVLAADTSTSSISVFPQAVGGGLNEAGRLDYVTGKGYVSEVVASGDVDGDGVAEAVVGNAGTWSATSKGIPGSVQVFSATSGGDLLAVPDLRWAGGVEISGRGPALAVADVGLVGPSRHPVDAAAGVHVSTETVTLTRHVECPDCHNAHEATETAASAPAVYGELVGAWGVSVVSTQPGLYTATGPQRVSNEHEVCLKCHSVWSSLGPSRDIATEVATGNPSVHNAFDSRATSAQAGSFVSPWAASSVLFCVDCHGNSSSTEATGPHRSADAPILSRPYPGTVPSSDSLLCYKCHDRGVYWDTGVGGSASNFHDSLYPRAELHKFHTADRGLGCESCHVSHGSATQPHLLRDDVGFSHSEPGGACTNACHAGASRAYDGT